MQPPPQVEMRSHFSPSVQRHSAPQFQHNQTEHLLGHDELPVQERIPEPADRLGSEETAFLDRAIVERIRHEIPEPGVTEEILQRYVEGHFAPIYRGSR